MQEKLKKYLKKENKNQMLSKEDWDVWVTDYSSIHTQSFLLTAVQYHRGF